MDIKQLKSKDVPELREKILKMDQYGLCPICGKKVNKPCLDHEHKKKLKGTGQIRGVVCLLCNIYLSRLENGSVRYGITKDDVPYILRNAADYLEKEQYPFLHPSEIPKRLVLKKSSYNIMLKELKKINYTKKIPEYRINDEDKKVQVLTKPLEKLFKLINIKPDFY